MTNIIKWLSIVAAGIVAFVMNLKDIYQVLGVFIILDMASGVIRAFVKQELTAKIAYTGILKKGGEIVIVLMAAYIQRLLPELSGVPLPEALAGFYVYYEGLSIIENAVALGVPIPQFLRDALAKLSPEKDIPPAATGERRARLRKG